MKERSMIKSTFWIRFLLLINVIPYSFGAFAQGDLLVYPTRVVFDGTLERVKILNFRNQGQDSATYRLSFIENRMTKSGNLEIIEEPDEGQLFASPYLRFYPRSITLAPGETQTVKIQLSRTNDLVKGEYRSHLYIRAEETTEALEEKSSRETPEGISIELKPIYGISIPNIIRIGNPKVEMGFREMSVNYEDEVPVLSLQLIRDGERSIKGTLEAILVDHEGTKTPVGKKTVVIYSPITFQNVSMKLNVFKGTSLSGGRLNITFTDGEGNKEVLAAESLDL